MSSKVLAAAVLGLECELVTVEADTSPALPGIFIVGLPDKSVDESKERVRSAIKNSGLAMPRTKVTVNLAPADLKKVGPAYDLPIAISILVASSQLSLKDKWSKQLFIGELALDGQLRPVAGVLSICLKAKALGINKVILPLANAAEASLVSGLEIIACKSLEQLSLYLKSKIAIEPFEPPPTIFNAVNEFGGLDMANIKGQHQAKRALEIAAAGGHNILFYGPPGSGKTLLAKTAVTILPSMTKSEALDVTRIYSVAGLLPPGQPLINQRPFRAPHHTSSGVACIIAR
ncbi:MAG: magnesium chelatase domain-containing protein [Patescibacteria group bacterium]|nr:magnesium chelatase domain-containing protein [Patescibacteria group bacterium]